MKINEDFDRLRDPENWKPLPPTSANVPAPRRHSIALTGLMAAAALALVVGVPWAFQHSSGTTSADHAAEHTSVPTAQSAGAVPWRPLPAHQGALLLTSATVAPPGCQPAQLKVSASGGGGAGGTFFVPVTVKETSSRGCTIADKQLRLRWAGGESVAGASRDRVLLPGGSQQYRLAFDPGCTTQPGVNPQPVSMQSGLADVAIKQTSAQLPAVVAGCSTATLTAVETPSAEDSGTGPYGKIKATLGLPQRVTGGTLSYMLILTNTGGSPFSFSSTCPTYTEMAGIGDKISQESYTLACSGGGPIDAGKSRSYDMKITLPQGTGVVKLAWIMDNGPSQSGATTAN